MLQVKCLASLEEEGERGREKAFLCSQVSSCRGLVCVCLAFPTFLKFSVELNIPKVQITSTSNWCESETQYLLILADIPMVERLQHSSEAGILVRC